MIVRHESDGSLVMITQNDHAVIAGLCAAHWGNDRFERPDPFLSTMRATLLHDLVWLKEESSPCFDTNTGQTPNFLAVPFSTQEDEYRSTIDWINRTDPYAGWLVSRHRTGIWKSRYGLMKQPHYPNRNLNADIEDLVARNHAEQDAAAATFDRQKLTINYILLQVWDLLSLYICSNEHLKELSIEPVPTSYTGEHGVCVRLEPVAPMRIKVDPYPFDLPSLEVSMVYRRLARQVFEDEPAFQRAYFEAPQKLAKFTFFDPETATST
jgi:hypothetical protein